MGVCGSCQRSNSQEHRAKLFSKEVSSLEFSVLLRSHHLDTYRLNYPGCWRGVGSGFERGWRGREGGMERPKSRENQRSKAPLVVRSYPCIFREKNKGPKFGRGRCHFVSVLISVVWGIVQRV
eukprot:9400734-Pyramimonas_sp.AAC.1